MDARLLEDHAGSDPRRPVSARGRGGLHGGASIETLPARAGDTVDPIGCGDAFRAGLIHGLVNGMDWEATGRLASLMGALQVEPHGTQNRRCSRAELESRFRESFGREL